MKIQNGISLMPAPAEAKNAERDAQLKQAAKMYEGHFLNEMVKAMRSTVGHEDGIVKQNMAEKIFTEQLDQQYVENWSNKGGVGLADMIYNQIHDQYFGSAQKQLQNLPHALPIKPKTTPIPLEGPRVKMLPVEQPNRISYRFDLPENAPIDVQAPLPATIKRISNLDQGWTSLELDHGQGLRSEMTFPGQSAAIAVGTKVQTGQKLGILDPERPTLAWNLEWS